VGKVADSVIVIATKDLTAEGFAAVRAELEKLRKETADHTEKSKSLADSVKKYFTEPIDQSKLALGAVTALGAGLAATAAGIVALGAHGADVADVRTHFQRLNEEIGNNAQTMLTTLADATGHTISNFDLMKSANLALSDGVKLTERDFGTLGRASRTLADATGGDTKAAFETLLDVMESGRTKALKNIGITIDQKKALEDYAATLHKTAADLTDHETKVATQNAVLTALEGSLKRTGDAQDDFADAVSRGRVFFENFTDDLSVGIANSPVLAAALGGVQQAMDQAFGGDQQGAVNAIVGFIEEAAITAVDFAQVGISVAGGLGRAFGAVKVVFDLVAEAILNMAQRAVDGIGSALELATHLPKVGSSFIGIAAAAKDTSTYLQAMQHSFREQATDAAEAVVGNSAFQRSLDGISKGVQTVRDAMVHARDAKHQDAEATDSATGALKRHGDETERSTALTKAAAAEAKKHAEAVKAIVAALSGSGAASAANDMLEALKQVGPISRLTVEAQKKIATTMDAAIEVYKAAGREIPAAWVQMANAARINSAIQISDTNDLIVALGKLKQTYLSMPLPDISVTAGLNGLDLSKLGTQVAISAPKINLFSQLFGDSKTIGTQLGNAIMGAIQGGGNIFGAAAGSLGQTLGTNTAAKFAAHFLKDGAGMFSKALGGVLSSALPVVGSLIGPLATALWGHFFGTGGRDAVKDFAQSVTGSTDLNAMHKYLQDNLSGDEAEKFWKALTQGVGRNNPQQAKAIIDQVTAAVAAHGEQVQKTAEDTAAAAEKMSSSLSGIMSSDELDALKKGYAQAQGEGFSGSEAQFLEQQLKFYDTLEEGDARLKTYFSRTTLDAFHLISAGQGELAQKLTDNIKGISDEMDGLIHQVAEEAPEAEMGVAERIARDRIEQLKKDKEAAETQLHDAGQAAIDSATTAAATAGQAAADSIETALRERDFRIHVHADIDSDGGMPGHAEGAYIRQDHVARVHAGEIIGPVDFIARAMQQAGGAGGGMVMAPIYLDGQKVADAVVRRTGDSVRRFGVRSLTTA
jgi:hypothetical protein